MANQKLTQRTELTNAADNDLVHIVDVSDTTDSPEGTSKKIEKGNLLSNYVKKSGDTMTGPLLINGQIVSSLASLQVNGFMRTGDIWIHEGGSTPTTSSQFLSNTSGDLYWGSDKVWHSGNDGAGSGLDADTLDGQQASDFVAVSGDTITGNLTVNGAINGAAVTQSAIDTTSGRLLKVGDFGIGGKNTDFTGTDREVSDFNAVTTTGFYSVDNGALNAPSSWDSSSKGSLVVQVEGGQGNRVNQFVTQGYPTTRTWFRGQNVSSAWTPWREFWHSGNDGPGSGLNADLLDGVSWGNVNTNIVTSGQLQTTGNEVQISGPFPRIDFVETGSTHNWNIIVDSDAFYIRSNGTSNTKLSIDTSGNLYAGGTTAAKYWNAGNDGSGSGLDADTLDGYHASAFVLASSDERLKENIEDYKPKEIKTKWRTFDFKEGQKNKIGVIAQELQKEHPEFVNKTEDGTLTVDYISLLVAKIAQQEKTINELINRIEILENK